MNAFEKIEADKTLPPRIKREMLANLALAKFAGEMVDLFFIRGSKTGMNLLDPQSANSDDSSPTE